MKRSGRSAIKSQPIPARPEAVAPGTGSKRNGREFIETFVVVFLGFLVWSLEAEGFVIPTGSMAPTLMGRHKEVDCPECGHVYTVDAGSEAEPTSLGTRTGNRVEWGTCENCRYPTRVDDLPSFSGDRVYTMKRGLRIPLLPQAGSVEPKRWDVTVFKLPEEPEVRYIKRLVGMPGEVIRIQQGDLWVRPLDGSSPLRRLLRPPDRQQAMQVCVHDDSHRPTALAEDPRWNRWIAATPNACSEPVPGTFRFDAAAGSRSELRYRHVVPDPDQWEAIRDGGPLPGPPRTTLITDYNSYNTDLVSWSGQQPRLASKPWFQPHWVGDLTLGFDLSVERADGSLVIELIKAGRASRCDIDLKRGRARLTHDGRSLGDEAPVAVREGVNHRVVLANVDDRLTLWFDGTLPFGDGKSLDGAGADDLSLPTQDDLAPARIRSLGASLEVSGLVLKRDIYYTDDPGRPDYEALRRDPPLSPRGFFDLLADPSGFSDRVSTSSPEYPLQPGRYLMLGDNSPWSRDGRAWGRGDQLVPSDPERGWDASGRASWEVPEELVIGRAFCVYWPHMKPIWPGYRLGLDLRVPARPYIEKIRWVR